MRNYLDSLCKRRVNVQLGAKPLNRIESIINSIDYWLSPIWKYDMTNNYKITGICWNIKDIMRGYEELWCINSSKLFGIYLSKTDRKLSKEFGK